jgi:cytochrome c oxidase subunit 1
MEGWDLWNMVASLGSFTLGMAQLIFVYNFLRHFKHGRVAGDDPWDGATLEWATSSPPPEHDFDRVPKVTSERPFFDQKYHGAPRTEPGREPHIHIPPPSYWPILMGLGITGIFAGVLFMPNPVVSICAGLLFVFTMFGWVFQPGYGYAALEEEGH